MTSTSSSAEIAPARIVVPVIEMNRTTYTATR
jgi:hypothetical protein